MAVKRELWKPPFETFPSWPCPTCDIGTVALIEETLKFAETGPSKKAHDHDAWEPGLAGRAVRRNVGLQ